MATIATKETTFRKTGTIIRVPPYDVCRLSYYLRSVTLSCGIDIIADDLVDFQNAHKLSQTRADSIFKLAFKDFKVDEVLGKTIFHDEDGDLCGTSNNEFLEVSNVTNVLSVQNEILIGGQVTKVAKIMVFKKAWLENNYFGPLNRNKARVQRAIGARDPAQLLTQLLQAITVEEVDDNDHCSHCKGKDGPCACKSSCDVKSGTKCSAVHHCSHCKGIAGGSCACEAGCPLSKHAKCVVLHDVICDGCSSRGLQGNRYKCSDCYDYDLCTKCYTSGKHDQTHSFKRIARVGSTPVMLAPRQAPQKAKTFGILRRNSAAKAPSGPKIQHNPATSSSNAGKFVGDGMSVSEMKAYLQENGVSSAGAVEKHDLKRLVWETQIESLGARELDMFMDAQGITRYPGSSVAVRRARAIAGFPTQERPTSYASAEGLAIGQTVELCRLQKTAMNGKLADVVRSEVINGKVKIRLLDETQKQYEVKPENLDIVSEVLE